MLINKTTVLTKFWLNSYYSDLDLSQKYLVKSLEKLPYLESITVSLNPRALFSAKDLQKIGLLGCRVLFMFFFSGLCCLPFLSGVPQGHLRKDLKATNADYCLSLQVKSIRHVNELLFLFFIAAFHSFLKKGTNFQFQQPLYLEQTRVSLFKVKSELALLGDPNVFLGSVKHLISEERAFLVLSLRFCNLFTANIKKSVRNQQFFWKLF